MISPHRVNPARHPSSVSPPLALYFLKRSNFRRRARWGLFSMVDVSMHSVSASIMDLARKNERAILHALAEHSQTKVAALIGVSDSTVTRTDKMAMGAFLAACGLKLVPANAQTFDASYIDALKVMAGVGLKSPSVVVTE